MGHVMRAAAVTAWVMATVLCAGVALPWAGGANAAPNKGAELLAGGIKSLQSGKAAEAIGTITSAISSGTLDSHDMAKALYYRGVAHRKQGQPAQAISDLTSAIWLKGGLTDSERADALEQRTAAYKDAGVASTPAVTAAPAVEAPRAPEAQQPSAPPAAPPAAAAVSQPWQTATAPAHDAASAKPASPPAVPAASPAASPNDDEPAAATPGSGVASFFGNLFGSGGAAPSAPAGATGLTTASTHATTAVSSWSDATSLSAASAPRPVPPTRTAAAAATPAAAAAPVPATTTAQPTGTYRVQVAAVRSRDAATEVARRLVKEHGFRLDQREPVVEEAIYGNMGTFYSVKVGPYADQSEPGKLCRVLRPSGFDCLIVSQ